MTVALLSAAVASALQSVTPSPPAELQQIIGATTAKCGSEDIGWIAKADRAVELHPGLLAKAGQVRCITKELKRAGIRYTFEDNRRR